MEKGLISGSTDLHILEIGLWARLKEEVLIGNKMEDSTKANGKII